LKTAASVIFAAWREILRILIMARWKFWNSMKQAETTYMYMTTLIFVQYSQRACVQKSLS
jgi:hypothetical protein